MLGAIFILFNLRETDVNYTDDTRYLNHEQVIEYFLSVSNRRKYAVLSDGMKGLSGDSSTVASKARNVVIKTKIISIEPEAINELPLFVKHQKPKEVVLYKVESEQYFCGLIKTKTNIALFYIGKETSQSPWLIYDIQGQIKPQ